MAYGHSTASFSAGTGGASVHVTITLAGLRPRTIYHYRLVATSSGGTTVGADRTFTTARPAGRAPRFAFHIRARASVRAALHGRLKVRFSCSKTCSAHFALAVAPVGSALAAAVPVTLAHAVGRLRSKGAGTTTIRFLAAVRNRLGGYEAVRLVLSGYAVSRGSAPSASRTAGLTLTP